MDTGTVILITSLIFILIILVIILAFVLYINYSVVSYFRSDVAVACSEKETTVPVFESISDLSIYDKKDALAVLYAAGELTLANGCGDALIIPQDCTVLDRFYGYDKISNTMQPLGILYLNKNLNMLILIFSGAIRVSEWLDLLTIKQVPPIKLLGYQSGMLVHEGMYEIYTNSIENRNQIGSMQDNIINAVNKAYVPGMNILVGGHSLGASLAVLVFSDLSQIYDANRSTDGLALYTTGCPRIGNNAFAKFISQYSNVFRLFNSEDLIPEVPPPIIDDIIYTQFTKDICFSMNLGAYAKNHTQAYINFLSS